MSSDNNKGSSKELFLFFKFIESETLDQARLFETINKELEAFLAKENNDKGVTDEILDFLATISDSVQQEFDELVSGDSDKKRFVRALSRIIALLLKTKVDTAENIKHIIKIAIETIWQEPKQQWEDYLSKQGAYLRGRSTENTVKKRTSYSFKIKQTLPEQKTVNIKKNGEIIKTINVKNKSKYFTGRNRLIF